MYYQYYEINDKDVLLLLQSSFSVNPSLPSSEVAEKLLPVLGEDATTTIVEYILGIHTYIVSHVVLMSKDPLGTQRISAEAMSYFLTNFGLESKDEWLLWVTQSILLH